MDPAALKSSSSSSSSSSMLLLFTKAEPPSKIRSIVIPIFHLTKKGDKSSPTPSPTALLPDWSALYFVFFSGTRFQAHPPVGPSPNSLSTTVFITRPPPSPHLSEFKLNKLSFLYRFSKFGFRRAFRFFSYFFKLQMR